jgi:hypothetical protein
MPQSEPHLRQQFGPACPEDKKFRSPLLVAYTGALVLAFHLRVILYEEPALSRHFGYEWIRYRATVNRWLPKLRPNAPDD